MARPISWLPRLPAIRHSVSESVRSHYSSSDLEQLFEIQPRSAQMILALLPTVRVGNSQLVEREALAGLLARLEAADNPARELAAIRAQGKPPIVRRKLRELVRRDVDAGLSSLPQNVIIEPGALAISFTTVEDLARSLWQLAQLLDEDLEGFAERYEKPIEADPVEEANNEQERADAAYIRDWLAQRP
jgi:hypothetical protein